MKHFQHTRLGSRREERGGKSWVQPSGHDQKQMREEGRNHEAMENHNGGRRAKPSRVSQSVQQECSAAPRLAPTCPTRHSRLGPPGSPLDETPESRMEWTHPHTWHSACESRSLQVQGRSENPKRRKEQRRHQGHWQSLSGNTICENRQQRMTCHW